MSEGTAAAPAAAPVATEAPAETTHETQAQPASPAAEQARKWKLRVGEQVEEVDDSRLIESLVSELGEDGVLSVAQISKAARAKMRQASEMEKRHRAIEAALADPKNARKILDKLYGKHGGARALAEEWIAEEIENERKPPEQREREKLSREIEEMRAERERLAKEREEREIGTKAQQAQRQIGSRFAEALKAQGLAPTEYAIAQMAQLAEADLDDGVPIDPVALAKQVRKRYREGDLGTMLRNLEPQALAELLGDDLLRKFRTWDVERVKAKQRATGNGGAQQTSSATRRERSGAVHVDDFFANLRAGKR